MLGDAAAELPLQALDRGDPRAGQALNEGGAAIAQAPAPARIGRPYGGQPPTGESDRAALASGNPVPVAHLQVTTPAPPSPPLCLSQLSAGTPLQNIFPGCNGRGMCTKVRGGPTAILQYYFLP